MNDKQNLGPGSTKDRLDAALEWNAAAERQAGKKSAADLAEERARERRRGKPAGAATGGERSEPEVDSPGDRGC